MRNDDEGVELSERLKVLETSIYSQNVESPGVVLRLDRIERLISTLLKGAGALGGIALIWKLLEVAAALSVRVGANQ